MIQSINALINKSQVTIYHDGTPKVSKIFRVALNLLFNLWEKRFPKEPGDRSNPKNGDATLEGS